MSLISNKDFAMKKTIKLITLTLITFIIYSCNNTQDSDASKAANTSTDGALSQSASLSINDSSNQSVQNNQGISTNNEISTDATKMEVDERGLSRIKVVIKTINGNIVFKFYPKKAPATVSRIAQLVTSGFYDNLTFHRVIPGFVIQGGDPTGTGSGGSGTLLKAEFNDIPHVRGTVAMARAQDINSADSQFYIALSTLPHLDNNYTVFGQVVEGDEFLDKVLPNDKILSATIAN